MRSCSGCGPTAASGTGPRAVRRRRADTSLCCSGRERTAASLRLVPRRLREGDARGERNARVDPGATGLARAAAAMRTARHCISPRALLRMNVESIYWDWERCLRVAAFGSGMREWRSRPDEGGGNVHGAILYLATCAAENEFETSRTVTDSDARHSNPRRHNHRAKNILVVVMCSFRFNRNTIHVVLNLVIFVLDFLPGGTGTSSTRAAAAKLWPAASAANF